MGWVWGRSLVRNKCLEGGALSCGVSPLRYGLLEGERGSRIDSSCSVDWQ